MNLSTENLFNVITESALKVAEDKEYPAISHYFLKEQIKEFFIDKLKLTDNDIQKIINDISKPQWIDVNNTLPEKGERVLTFPEYIICQYDIENVAGDIIGIEGEFSYYNEYWDEDRKPDYPVTHWTPLLNPPKPC